MMIIMKTKNNAMIILISIIFISAILFSKNAIASCTPDSWYSCEGSYSVHYVIGTDCTTSSNSQYCSYGCSGGSCNSAPSYTSTVTQYPTYTSTYTYYPTYTTSYFYQPCYQQYISNYRCNGNEIQEEYQFSDCSTTWYDVQPCQYGCYNNNQCLSQQQTQTQTFTSTITSTIQQCVFHATGNYQCVNNQQQAQYQYPDCSFQWVTQINCPNGCSGEFCTGASSTSTSTTTYTSTITTTYQSYINNYPYPYQVPYYYYQYSQYPYYQTYNYNYQNYNYQRCTAGTTNNYQCSGNVQQVQYRNSDCSTYWTNAQTCPYGCSGGYCLQAQSYPQQVQSVVTTTVTVQPSYGISSLEAFVIILAVIVIAIYSIRYFSREPERNRNPRYEPEYWR